MRYKDSKNSNTIDIFVHTTTTMNPIVVAQFFKTIYKDIFNYLLATRSSHCGFLRPVSIYFEIVEINGREMLYLYDLIWLCEAHHLIKICNQLYLDTMYVRKMVEFINNII